MKSITTLSMAALLVAGVGLAVPTKVFAHGNDANHQVSHIQRKQADHARHDAGISRQQDKVIHRQERRQDRIDHQVRNNSYNGYNTGYYQNSGGIGNSLSNWLGGSTYPSTQYNSGAYGSAYSAPYYNNQNGISSTFPSAQYNIGAYGSAYSAPYYNNQNGISGSNGYGTAGNGHVYTSDGHRLDHHGNHDDGPGDF